MKALALFLMIFTFTFSLSANDELFSSLNGFWRGRGKITVSGNNEPVRCRAWVTKKTKKLRYKITCVFSGSKFTVKSQISTQASNKVKGTWTESYFESKGRASGSILNNKIKLRLTAPQEGGKPLTGILTIRNVGNNVHTVSARVGKGSLAVVLCKGKKTCKVNTQKK